MKRLPKMCVCYFTQYRPIRPAVRVKRRCPKSFCLSFGVYLPVLASILLSLMATEGRLLARLKA